MGIESELDIDEVCSEVTELMKNNVKLEEINEKNLGG
jgi:hypothetical protein